MLESSMYMPMPPLNFEFAEQVVFYKFICKIIFKSITTLISLMKQKVSIRIVNVPLCVLHRLLTTTGTPGFYSAVLHTDFL
jgi:hypothetical protein